MKISEYKQAADKLNQFTSWSHKERGYDRMEEFRKACEKVSEVFGYSMKRIVSAFQKVNLNN